MTRSFSSISVILTTLCGVSILMGCSGTKETLGLSRRTPDAFSVVLGAPLALPPDYSLPPPMPGSPRPQDISPSDQAKQTLLGKAAPPGGPSNLEAAILNKSSADQAPANIRTIIASEQGEDIDDNTPIGRKLLGFGSSSKDTSVIDPVVEKKRIEDEQSVIQAKP